MLYPSISAHEYQSGGAVKVYVATAFTQVELARTWMDALRQHGITISHDWSEFEKENKQGELNQPLEDQYKFSRNDLQGVADADIVWLLSPAAGGTGCWVEYGYALALGKPVIVSGSRRSIFVTQSTAFHVEHLDALKEILSWRDLLQRHDV